MKQGRNEVSILAQMVLIEKHGLRVDLEGLASILDTTPPNLRRMISAHTLQIPTYIDGGRRWADVRDVADYFDLRRQEARRSHSATSIVRSERKLPDQKT